MSDSEEDSGSVGRQKSIFSGMGRVKQINHLREKWSPKPKSPLPADRTFVESPPSSPWSRRPSPDKYAQGPYAGDSGRGSPQSVKGSPRRQPVVTVVDMERYLAINTWLEHNGVNVAQINASPDKRGISKDYGLFDDMYSSLDILENSLMSELAYLNFSSDNGSENVAAAKAIETSTDPLSVSSPALFDYLVVIAPDMVDVTIRNYWNLRENVFEATVAFAHPPESQFRVESLEHFCFPTGINATTGTTAASIDKSVGENSSSSSRHGEFFVLMISGGGVQGQSVQYAMCMKGTVQIPDGGDDGKNLLLPICYCIIAQIPFIPFFRAVLQGLLDNLRNELEAAGCSGSASIITDKHAGYVDDTLQNLKRIPLPDKGLSVSVDVFPPPSAELILTRPHKEHDADEKLPIMDEPEPGSVKLSSASSPTARIFSSMKNSPNEKAESPTRGQELLSPTPSEQSAQADRPVRTFVWPLSQSELDIFWVADEANAVIPTVVSPGAVQRLVLHSPMSDTFESPRRSPNNESVASYVDGPKSASRSEHGGIVNAQRADTDTTISIFDTAMSEALGSADTVDDAWLFDTSDDHILSSHQDDDSDEDRGTKRDSSAEEYGTPPHNDEHVKDEAFEQNASVNNPRRSWHQGMNDQNDDRTEYQESHDTELTPDQAKILITGISIDSRGAWDGWCEGEMFVSPDFTTLTWERRAVAFAALNMNIADIASIVLEEAQTIPTSEIKQRRIQLNFGIEAIHFQFSNSPHHDEFFGALQHLVRPTPDRGEGRKETLSSVSPVPSPVPYHPPTSLRNEEQHVAPGNHEEDTTVAAVHAVPAQQETDIDQFKRKLQRGFLVEKHGRLGKPHAKVIFTDALCTHIMWRNPPATGAGDHHDLEHLDDQLHHRPSLFSHNKSIPVDSITAIVTGRHTTVFRRAAANKSNERMCLSILTPTRTLDICAYSLEGFQELHRGFSSLLEEIKRTRDRLD
ncbi:hypothetical protein PR001_g5153 [Phytophthora rubi]|uniref:Uncharacterized protein n=1 Tax=Phytophthora rubi TaxID=129364 RepID=A0A6A3NUP2_9STRA|nr:hypothetical protein PR001_g5153 [Phytophthora rubi]